MLSELLCTQQNQLLQKAIQSGKTDGLVVRMFKGKGRGIVADRIFKSGDFVVEYKGQLMGKEAAKRREDQYDSKGHYKGYMFFFKHQDRGWCVDATAESGDLGRLINHSCNFNLVPRIVEVEGFPHIALIASQTITAGSEIVYDYAETRPSVLKANPWLSRSRTQAPQLAVGNVDEETFEENSALNKNLMEQSTAETLIGDGTVGTVGISQEQVSLRIKIVPLQLDSLFCCLHALLLLIVINNHFDFEEYSPQLPITSCKAPASRQENFLKMKCDEVL
jgi:hypothetical protein